MMRVTATLLDSFRLFHEADFITVEELDARIRRDPIAPTPAMRLGTAFHAIAEGTAAMLGDPLSPEGAAYEFDGFRFDARSADEALREYRDGVPEVRGEREIETDFGLVRLVGKADYLKGISAREIKTRDKDFDPLSYAESYQWRVYCRVFRVPVVYYDLCRLEFDEGSGLWFVRAHDELPLYTYPELGKDVERMTRAFLRHAAARGLLGYLDLDQREAA